MNNFLEINRKEASKKSKSGGYAQSDQNNAYVLTN